MSDLSEGHVGEWQVVAHHPFGVEVALVDDPGTHATIDMPYLRDLGPSDRIDGPQDFPAVGERIRAMVRTRWPDGALHLTARASDLPRES